MNTIWLKLNDERMKQVIEWGAKVIQFLIIPIGGLTVWWVQHEIKTYGETNFASKRSVEVIQEKVEKSPLVTYDQYHKLVERINANDHQTAVALANLQAEVKNLNSSIRDLRDDIRDVRKK